MLPQKPLKEAEGETGKQGSHRHVTPATEEPPDKSAKQKSKSGPKGKTTEAEVVEDNNVELVESPSSKVKGKRKAVETDKPKKPVQDKDLEPIQKSKGKPEKSTSQSKGVIEQENDGEEERSHGDKGGTRAGSKATDDQKGKRSRVPSRAEGRDGKKGKEADDDNDADLQTKKKKRKIIPFSTTQTASMNWGQLSLVRSWT